MHFRRDTCSNVILMIDDNPTDVLLIKEAFAFCEGNEEIYVAEDGIQAIELLKQQGQYLQARRPDLILLDLNMPKKNGFEVLSELKADPDFRSIPVIIYTSSVAKEDIRMAYQHYANGYIRKSVDFDNCIKIARLIKEFWFSVSILYKP